MQIRIIIQWSRRQPTGGSFTVRSLLKRGRCLALGHSEEIVVGERALAVQCRVCGWKSSGLTLDYAQPRPR